MKKKIYLLLIMLITLVTVNVNAEQFAADDSVTMTEPQDSTTFVAGNNVTSNSDIDGLNFVAGNMVTVSGKQDYLFTAGNEIVIANAEAKDAFVAGSKINITSSNVRDVYVVGEDITISSDIRTAYIAGEKITINGAVTGDVKLAAEEIIIGENANISGTLTYPEDAEINIASTAKVASTKTYKGNTKNVSIEVTPAIVIKNIIVSILTAVATGLILFALNKKTFESTTEMEANASNLVKTLLKGFLFLIAVPFASIFLFVTVLGVPLGFISLAVYFMLVYLSTLSTAYYLGKNIFQDKINNDYLMLAITIAAIKLLKLIPFLGGFVGTATLFLGLGIYVNLFKKRIENNK